MIINNMNILAVFKTKALIYFHPYISIASGESMKKAIFRAREFHSNSSSSWKPKLYEENNYMELKTTDGPVVCKFSYVVYGS